jgi:hypothetical protein
VSLEMKNGTRYVVYSVVLMSLLNTSAWSQPSCDLISQGAFPTNAAETRATTTVREQVKLVRSKSGTGRIGIFNAPLAINTDGAPNSYHPEDILGETLAINRMRNGIVIRKGEIKLPCRPTNCAEYDRLFSLWRAAGFQPPENVLGLEDVRISWQSVMAATPAGRPCVFGTGSYQGYFGSLTALKNGLSNSAAGECEANNQLDLRVVPAIVLRGASANPLHSFGTRVGDLALAINPATGVIVPSIVGDSGDADRIGEGSIALNMKLLGRRSLPRNYIEALALDTGSSSMIIATFPSTKSFQLQRPHTAQSIESRVSAWAAANGYSNLQSLGDHIRLCASGL